MRNFRGTLLVASGEHTLELTASAAFVFRCVDGTRSIGEIATCLAETYGVSWDIAVQDVAELVDELARSDIADLDAVS
jgi:hypothetical protein